MTQVETGVAGGVSFALTPEQRELRALAREFAEKEIRPKAAEYDEHSTHPVDVIAKAHELGLMNLHVPESLGGLGLPAFDGMLVGEELNWGCSGIGTSILANGLGAGPVLIAGTDEQKETWLPPLLEEPILCSFGLSEPDAGSDVARMKTTAERRGDEYVLNGSKTFITNAGHATWTVVFAKTDPSKGHRGISAFVVPMDTPGVQIEKHLDKMGQRVDGHVRVRAHRRRRARREPPRRGGRGLQDRDEDARLHAARARRPAPSASRRPRTSSRSSTRRSASRSTSRSRCTRASTS